MPTGWEDFLLGQQPQWAYFSSSPFTSGGQQGGSPAQEQYWRGQFGNIWNRYLGELGTATRKEETMGSFTDYLEDLPFTQMYYQNVSPRQRGGESRYNPATRYVF